MYARDIGKNGRPDLFAIHAPDAQGREEKAMNLYGDACLRKEDDWLKVLPQVEPENHLGGSHIDE